MGTLSLRAVRATEVTQPAGVEAGGPALSCWLCALSPGYHPMGGVSSIFFLYIGSLCCDRQPNISSQKMLNSSQREHVLLDWMISHYFEDVD